MTKYQETAIVRRAVQKQLRKDKKKTVEYVYRGVRYEKSELPKYITDNPFYP